MANNHSFLSTLKNSRVFSLVVYGFSISTSLSGFLRQKILFTFNNALIKLQLRFPSGSVTLRFNKILVSANDLLVKINILPHMTLRLNKISFVGVLHQTLRLISATLRFPKTTLTGVAHLSWRFVGTPLRIPKFTFGLSPTYATYYYINFFDPDLMSADASKLLSDMDYKIV